MKRGVNKVILVGNLGNDPDVRFTPGGTAVANLSVATSETWKDKNTHQQQEKTEWHRVVLFGKMAEVAQQYLVKGSKVYLEGKLQTRKWQAKDGTDRYTTEIVVDGFDGQMQMLDARSGDNRQQQGQQQPQQNQEQTQYRQQYGQHGHQRQQPQGQQQQQKSAPAGGFDDFSDDIPFMRHMAGMEYLA